MKSRKFQTQTAVIHKKYRMYVVQTLQGLSSDMNLLRGPADFRRLLPYHQRIDYSFLRITFLLWNLFTLTSLSRVILQVSWNYFVSVKSRHLNRQLYQIITFAEFRV